MKSFVSKLTLICLFVSGLFITGCKQDLIEKNLDSVEYGSLVISNGDNANRALDFSAITQAEITISGYEMEDLSQVVDVTDGAGKFFFEKVKAGKNRVVTVKSNIDGVQMRAIVDIEAGQTNELRSRAPRGSSRRRTRGCEIRARAIATLCCCPPESVLTLLFSKPESATILSISVTLSLISFSLIFFKRRGKAIFSYTFKWGKRAYFWNTVFT